PPGAGLSHSCTWGRTAEKMNKLSDDEIVKAMIKELQRFAPNMTDKPDLAEVVRWDEAICLEPPGQFPAMYCFKNNHKDDIKGLHFAGEYMILISCVEGALRSGENAANAVLREGS
ncbi:MAG: FAD-dependent oxidoreductase, partial [Actinobacteria bacterium]|nr:FAD-dependent oxidoreductase [Actinomycetota bacterium]